MADARTIGELAACFAEGRWHTAHFRKVPSQASVAGQWVDLSMAPGNPQPNYYVGSPYEATVLNGQRGIFTGDARAPSTQRIVSLSLCTPTAALVGAYKLLDYLLFYPLIDLDDVSDQPMDNTTTLPRYATGEGVRAMLVVSNPTLGSGSLRYTYVDSDGEARTSPTILLNTSADAAATIVTSQQGTSRTGQLFLPMHHASRGIRSVTSIEVITPNGGLATLVLVRPLVDAQVFEINVVSQRSYVTEMPHASSIVDGAFLGLVANCAGTIAAGQLTGNAVFTWK